MSRGGRTCTVHGALTGKVPHGTQNVCHCGENDYSGGVFCRSSLRVKKLQVTVTGPISGKASYCRPMSFLLFKENSLKSTLSIHRLCLFAILSLSILLMSGCASKNLGTGVELNNDGTMLDTRTGAMWQQVRSDKQFTSSAEAEAYAAGLELAGFSDWRLPTSQEIWDLYFANDYAMDGELVKLVKLEGSYWAKDGDRILAGYLEDGDDPGINRYFYDSDKGYVRAVRSTR